MVIITTKTILKSISTNWKNLTSIQNDLEIKDNLDIRFLKVKLKEFERKKLVECKDISGEKYYKCINDLQDLEKKEVLPKKRPTSKKKSVPKKRPTSKMKSVPIEETLKNINKVRSGMLIIKVVKLKEIVKADIEFLKKHPYDEIRKEALKITQEEIEKVTLELIEYSYYLCPYCLRAFANNYDLSSHKLTHQNFVAKFYGPRKVKQIECHYCGQKFNNLSSLISHEFTSHMNPREVDLHGLYVKEAILKVKETLIECDELGDTEITLIHGYHYGHALRDYFRSTEFIREMKNFGFAIDLVQITDPGTTGFSFRFISEK